MQFRPLHDRVVVRRIDAEEKSKGGIIIPDTAKEKPQEGEIIAAGPGARDESGKVQPLDVKAGDRVLFGKWSGTEVRIDGEDLLIMKESPQPEITAPSSNWHRAKAARAAAIATVTVEDGQDGSTVVLRTDRGAQVHYGPFAGGRRGRDQPWRRVWASGKRFATWTA